MADFTFHRSPDTASSPETHYPAKASNTPQSDASSPLFDDHGANSSYFQMPTSHETKRLYFNEASKDCYFPTSRSSPEDVPTYSQPRWNDVSNPSLASIYSDSLGLSNFHRIELAKITEYETWSISQLGNSQKGVNSPALSYPPTLSSYQQDTHPSLSPKTEYTSHQRSPLARANSGSGKPLSRPGSSQTPFHPKRRMSASGTPEATPSTPITDPGLSIEEVSMIEPKPKTSTKISHSITERRYRENLNSKIAQLDQTLSSIRNLKDQAQNFEAQDESCVETPIKTRKADVLIEAMRYVKQAEHESEARNKEIEFLRLRIAALEKLVNCGDCALLKQYAGQQTNSPTDF